jgi:hypothetical protein
MHRRRLSFPSLFRLFLWIAIFLLLPGSSSLRSHPQITHRFEMHASEGLAIAADGPLPSTLPPPGVLEEFMLTEARQADTQSTQIQVNFIGEWTAEQINAMNYAAFLWSKYVYSPVPIVVDVEWKVRFPAFSPPLGTAVYMVVPVTDPRAPYSSTSYPASLASAITGKDQSFNMPDIAIYFTPADQFHGGAKFSWYFGIDGKPPSTSWDFVSVAMHEIGHGLLGGDSFIHDYEKQITGWGGALWGSQAPMPYIFDWYFTNSSGQRLMETSMFPNPSQQLFDQFTVGNIHFKGPQTLANNTNNSAAMDPFSSGHLADDYEDTPNGMMVPGLSNGTARHHPGPIMLGMLADIGWTSTAAPNTAPSIHQLPVLMLEKDRYYLPRLDLWAYTSDTHSHPSELAFSITNSPAAEAGVSLRSNRYIDIQPADGWIGETRVTIMVQDPEGLSSTASLTLLVLEKVYQTLLPSVQK